MASILKDSHSKNSSGNKNQPTNKSMQKENVHRFYFLILVIPLYMHVIKVSLGSIATDRSWC